MGAALTPEGAIMSLCQYGDCANDTKRSASSVRVTITSNRIDEKTSAGFCCQVHAALWLAHQAKNRPTVEPLDELKVQPT
jgi:hypothetical protein